MCICGVSYVRECVWFFSSNYDAGSDSSMFRAMRRLDGLLAPGSFRAMIQNVQPAHKWNGFPVNMDTVEGLPRRDTMDS